MPPEPKLFFSEPMWTGLVRQLNLRTRAIHESGAFLLGRVGPEGRAVQKVIFYDDLDPKAYETGVVVLQGDSFGPLWAACAAEGLSVVADVHVHELAGFQSRADQMNPMIAQRGHLALILPDFAVSPINARRVGFYQYLGSHRWRSLGGETLLRHLVIAKDAQ